MTWISNRLRAHRADEGISLIEVIVAMMVFSIIAIGVSYSILSIIRITEDARLRQVATNLAASEIDSARATTDAFKIVNGNYTTQVGNTTYTINRATSWVTTSGSDVACGTGTATLQAKRVNVTVTWTGMLTTTPPVRSDTLISPDQRINDPSLGTILVSVLGVAGTGSSGVAVSIVATSGGSTLTTPVPVTDTDGCSFALKVKAGTYSVTLSRSNSIDNAQIASPSKSVVVVAGASVATQFQYDYASTFNLVYAGNTANVKFPTDLDTSYVNSYGVYVASGKKSQIALHPYGVGYSGIAGEYVAPAAGAGCVSVDPAAWPAGTVNGVKLAAGIRTPAVATAPQGQATMNIPMGLVTVKYTGASNLYAISTTPPTGLGDPGCSLPMTYSYGSALINGTITIALPYGSWKLSRDAAGTSALLIPTSSEGIVAGTRGYLTSTNSVVTIDPRAAG